MHLKFISLAAVFIILLASPAWPQAAESTDIETGVSYESLTHGLAPWRTAYLQLVTRSAQRKAIYVTIEETERFNRSDTQFTAGIYHPLDRQWTALFEGSVSPTHNVLGKWSGFGQIGHDFGSGWGAYTGLRHREYSSAAVNVGNFALEKYIKAFRAAYTFYASHLESAGFATTHRVEMNYYYLNSAVNLNVAYGRDLENIPPTGILRTNVKLLNLGGTHWFNSRWGLSYAGNWQEQGRIYTRRGLTLGLRHRL